MLMPVSAALWSRAPASVISGCGGSVVACAVGAQGDAIPTAIRNATGSLDNSSPCPAYECIACTSDPENIAWGRQQSYQSIWNLPKGVRTLSLSLLTRKLPLSLPKLISLRSPSR